MSEEKSKNQIGNSSIKIGGNMQIGDIIHIHTTQQLLKDQASISASEVTAIKTQIAQGKLNQAIHQLLAYAKVKGETVFNEAIGVAQQLEDLQREERIGVISFDDKTRQRSKITMSTLKILDQIQ